MNDYKGLKWHKRFLALAEHIATWSKDPSTKVGAVIVDTKRCVIGMGYNGFPRGVHDNPDRYNDRPTKYQFVVHAEPNAILNCHIKPIGATIYTWPFFTCNDCAKLIIQSGIKRVIAPPTEIERWADSLEVAKRMYHEANVEVMFIE